MRAAGQLVQRVKLHVERISGATQIIGEDDATGEFVTVRDVQTLEGALKVTLGMLLGISEAWEEMNKNPSAVERIKEHRDYLVRVFGPDVDTGR